MAESARNPRIAQVQEEMRDRVQNALTTAIAAIAPCPQLDEARHDLADLVATLGGGLCQGIVMAAKNGRDHRKLCAQLRAIVEKELDALEARSSLPAGAVVSASD